MRTHNSSRFLVILNFLLFVLIIREFMLTSNNISALLKIKSSHSFIKNDIYKSFIKSSKVDSALIEKTKINTFEFTAEFKSPFALSENETNSFINNEKQKESTPKLHLKGILDKKNALAILEDDAGKTYICTKGDKINDWVILTIEGNSVVIKNGTSTIVLKVKENGDAS